MKLLTVGNAKTSKGEKLGYLTGILYLLPQKSGGLGNLCPMASAGCIESCLNTAGRGAMSYVKDGIVINKVLDGRKRKTNLYFSDRAEFLNQLRSDIKALVRKANRENLIPCVRLNGTSDLPQLDILMANEFPEVQFYSYTKIFKTLLTDLPANYHVTFSRSETNETQWKQALALGFNVSVLFMKKDIPKRQWQNIPVKSGDDSDLRFLDGKQRNGFGKIIALTAKGKAKKDTTNFVYRF